MSLTLATSTLCILPLPLAVPAMLVTNWYGGPKAPKVPCSSAMPMAKTAFWSSAVSRAEPILSAQFLLHYQHLAACCTHGGLSASGLAPCQARAKEQVRPKEIGRASCRGRE